MSRCSVVSFGFFNKYVKRRLPQEKFQTQHRDHYFFQEHFQTTKLYKQHSLTHLIKYISTTSLDNMKTTKFLSLVVLLSCTSAQANIAMTCLNGVYLCCDAALTSSQAISTNGRLVINTCDTTTINAMAPADKQCNTALFTCSTSPQVFTAAPARHGKGFHAGA
jgi:hypothetical protein